eukprot:TRINITY_DN45024_c0_g1_i1.p1 TRINITY_DN45024_c0_g1~~TRINITY_DN45024_c0_g1_i1.p1  ORF type:complete len:397 (+),score=61.69 TRINITY_DN45024_c0_g1_i1:107-1297(+)
MAECLRVAVVGGERAGKTALVTRFVAGSWTEDYEPNVVDRYKKQETVDGDTVVLHITDTGGAAGLGAARAAALADADAVLCCYSVADAGSLERARGGWQEVLRATGRDVVPCVLVACQCDLPERAVTEEEGVAAAADWLGGGRFARRGVPHVCTSARCDDGVAEAFHDLVREARGGDESLASSPPGSSLESPLAPIRNADMFVAAPGDDGSPAGSPLGPAQRRGSHDSQGLESPYASRRGSKQGKRQLAGASQGVRFVPQPLHAASGGLASQKPRSALRGPCTFSQLGPAGTATADLCEGDWGQPSGGLTLTQPLLAFPESSPSCGSRSPAAAPPGRKQQGKTSHATFTLGPTLGSKNADALLLQDCESPTDSRNCPQRLQMEDGRTPCCPRCAVQ